MYDSYKRSLKSYKGTIAAVVLTFLDQSLSLKKKNKGKTYGIFDSYTWQHIILSSIHIISCTEIMGEQNR